MNGNKKLLACIIIVLALILLGAFIMVVKNGARPGELKYGIFGDIGELDALNEYVVPEKEPAADNRLNGLNVVREWRRTVKVDSSSCEVCAYVFETHEEAETYYKAVSNRTKAGEGANGSASAGGLFGKAEYVTMYEDRVLTVSGRSIGDIVGVLNVFFEKYPEALKPFS
ncbi:MAG: hypothetical protein J5772_05315 [Clostridia bacterium]|nr:hypothetical protein [Clostridia bacterium]